MSPIGDYLYHLYKRSPRGSSSSSSGSRSSSSSSSSSSKSSSGSSGVNRGSDALKGSSLSSSKSNSGSSSSSSSRKIPSTGSPGTSSSKSLGGGAARIIAKGLVFAGRKFGGGRRPLIAGGAAYGGYNGYSRVQGNNFAYGYWPMYYGPRYYGNDEYGPSDNSSRPGGPLVATSFSSPTSTSPLPQYLIHGDAISISTILTSLTTACSALTVVPSTPLLGANSYLPSTNLSLLPIPNPSNIQQYYRESSFALYAYFTDLVPSPEASINLTIPSIPPFLHAAALRNTSFETCVTATISENLPIEEGVSGGLRLGVMLQGVGVGAKGQLCVLALVVGLWGSM